MTSKKTMVMTKKPKMSEAASGARASPGGTDSAARVAIGAPKMYQHLGKVFGQRVAPS